MTTDDPRWRDGVTSAIAALQAGERHSVELFETLRKEIRESEQRQSEKIIDVGKDCADFRHEVRERWVQEIADRKQREKDRAAARWTRSQKLTVASIVIGVCASPIMLVLGVGPG